MSELTYLKLSTEEGTWLVDPKEWNRLDAQVSAYIESAGSRDSLLSLTLLNGDELRVRASDCVSWFMSSPDSRDNYWKIQAALQEGETAAKRRAGIFEAE